MTSRVAKRSLILAVGFAAFVAGLLIALPFIASTQIVRDRIAQEFSSWSGYRVTLGGAPKIEVWPTIRASLPNVELSGWGAGTSQPVISSKAVEIDLSAFSALQGDIVPVRVRFLKPVLRLTRQNQELPVLQSPAGGKLRRAIEMARVAIADNPAEPDLSALPPDPFGIIEFSQASIVETGADDQAIGELISGLSGVLEWPNLNGGLSIIATGTMNAETIEINGRIAEPLLLLAGGNAQTSLTFDSEPIKLSFDGQADIEQPIFIDGTAQISTPSLTKLLKWAGSDIPSTTTVGNMTISGRVKGEVSSVKIEEAEIVVGQNPGMGIIEIALAGAAPSVSGTLAFDNLDLVSFLSTLAILPASPAGSFNTVSAGPFGQFNLDLRLSANNAMAGTAELTDVAAAVQITDKLATFDISDATGFGGNISAGIRINREKSKQTGEFRLLADGIDSSAMAEAAGFTRMIPQARGKISVILNGPLARPNTFFRLASGSIAATFDTGTIPDLDLPSFMEKASIGGFFPLSDVSGGTLAFERAELKAVVAEGVAKIEIAEARTAQQLISLAGIVPYIGRSLALSGTITQIAEAADAPSGTTFFAGGSWNAPFILAVLPPTTGQ